jgi:hypothetical protein
MTATVEATNGAGTTAPLSTLSPYEATHTGRNVILDLLGGGLVVALIAPRPRSGTIEYLYGLDEAAARAGTALHREESTFILTDEDRPDIGMEYVVSGDVRLRLDEETQDVWILAVDYQEV